MRFTERKGSRLKCMDAKPGASSKEWAAELDDLVRTYFRGKFRTSFRAEDGTKANQDALDLASDVRAKIVARVLDKRAEPVQNLEHFARTVCRLSWTDYLRAKYPRRFSFSTRVRRFLDKESAYAVWQSPDCELLCGYSGWRNRPVSPGSEGMAQRLLIDPDPIPRAALPGVDEANMERADWIRLLDAVFDYVEGPLPLSSLIGALSTLAAVREVREVSSTVDADDDAPPLPEPKDRRLSPEESLKLWQQLRIVWQSLTQMKRTHRVAYLLNPPTLDKNERAELLVFVSNGITSISGIGAALELSDQNFELFWQHLPLDDEARARVYKLAEYSQRFYVVWRHLPVQDVLIGLILGANSTQVAGLRRVAMETLARSLRDSR